MSANEPWAIVRLGLSPPRETRERWAHDAALFAELGALLAAAPHVGGVEHATDTPERPELRLYSTPEHVDEIVASARAWASQLGLDVVVTGEVRTDDDWHDTWKQFYAPIVVGDGALLLRPSWIPRRPDDPKREVVLDPGRAFGTGLHETTRLCLDRLCVLAARGFVAQHVLDLGCGSGILALCAARLFPSARVVALDDDPEATATTTENAELNGLADRLAIVTGDLATLPATPTFDLVLANIRAETLVPLAAGLGTRTTAGGHVVLSGVLVEERDDVEQAYVATGFACDVPPRTMGIWCAIDLWRSS